MLAALPVSSLVSGPMKSQVGELMWASSASLESDRNEQIAERTNGQWGRAVCLQCLTPCMAGSADLSLKGSPLPSCAAFLK